MSSFYGRRKDSRRIAGSSSGGKNQTPSTSTPTRRLQDQNEAYPYQPGMCLEDIDARCLGDSSDSEDNSGGGNLSTDFSFGPESAVPH